MSRLVTGNPFYGIEMLNQSLDQRNAMRRQNALDQEDRQKNALAMQLQQMQVDEAKRAQSQQVANQGAQRGFYENIDYLQGDFPQRSGELISEMGRQYPGADLSQLNSLAQQFKPVAPEYQIMDGQYVPKQPGGQAVPVPGYVPKGPELSGEAANLKILLGRPPTLAELEQHKKAGATNITVDNGKRESKLVETVIEKEMPALSAQAKTSRSAMGRIDKALAIVEKQGDGVTGFSGAVKRALAPFASAAKVNISGMNDAQILSALLKEGAGSLRSQVVGPGPVSNYEQGILQQVSGGDMAAAEGVVRILEHHRQMNEQAITDYNDKAREIGNTQGYEAARRLYPEIKFTTRKPSEQAPMEGAKKAPDGKWYVQKNGQWFLVEE